MDRYKIPDAGPAALFVYGLLMSAFDNGVARTLKQRALSITPARIQGRLYDLGSYPAATWLPCSDVYVTGELIRIPEEYMKDLLHQLDQFEGIDPVSLKGPEYIRQVIPVEANEQQLNAWCYLYNGNSTDLKVIPSGKYLHQ